MFKDFSMSLRLRFFALYLTATISSLCYAQNKQLTLVKIEFQGFDTETIFDVDCDRFHQTFKETMSTRTFTKKSDLVQFQSYRSRFRMIKSCSGDIRGTITFKDGEKSTRYCFDTFGRFFIGNKVYQNINLLSFISDKLYRDHPVYLDTLKIK